MLCKDSKQHHVIFHEFYSVSSLLCIAQNVRFEIPYKVLYFETPFLMIFKYYAWASYALNSDNMQRHVPIRINRRSSLHTRRNKGLLITGNNCFSLNKEKLKIMKIGLHVLPAIRRGNLSSPEKGKRGERNYDCPLSLPATVLPELLPSNHPLEFDSVLTISIN